MRQDRQWQPRRQLKSGTSTPKEQYPCLSGGETLSNTQSGVQCPFLNNFGTSDKNTGTKLEYPWATASL
jgi:hypothetical protein